MDTNAKPVPTLAEAMLSEFDAEAESTRRLLGAVPPEHYDWRPHEKGRSMGELCAHIASAIGAIPLMLDQDRFDMSGRPRDEAAPESREALLARLEEGLDGARAWLAGIADRITGEWAALNGDVVMMSLPRWMAVRMILFNHIYHHRGQLSAYLRAAGDAVPSVYGPTADENPFASG